MCPRNYSRFTTLVCVVVRVGGRCCKDRHRLQMASCGVRTAEDLHAKRAKQCALLVEVIMARFCFVRSGLHDATSLEAACGETRGLV